MNVYTTWQELQRQKAEYEAKKKMAERLRREVEEGERQKIITQELVEEEREREERRRYIELLSVYQWFHSGMRYIHELSVQICLSMSPKVVGNICRILQRWKSHKLLSDGSHLGPK